MRQTASAIDFVGDITVAAFTLRLPDDKNQRLRALAQARRTTINRLLNEMTTQMLAALDAETRFKLRVARGAGRSEMGLGMLDKADQRGTPQPT